MEVVLIVRVERVPILARVELVDRLLLAQKCWRGVAVGASDVGLAVLGAEEVLLVAVGALGTGRALGKDAVAEEGVEVVESAHGYVFKIAMVLLQHAACVRVGAGRD